MTNNTTPFHRQSSNTPEKLLLERLEIILNKRFKSTCVSEDESDEPDSEAEAYYHGAEEVKEYIADALKIYAYEKGVYDE